MDVDVVVRRRDSVRFLMNEKNWGLKQRRVRAAPWKDKQDETEERPRSFGLIRGLLWFDFILVDC